MNQIFVRPARETDFNKFEDWVKNNPALDKRIFTYPSTYTWAAFNDSGVIAFLPVQVTFTMEAMAFHPLSTDPQRALSMKELTHNLITQAYLRGIGEIYFLGTDPTTNDFAERQGFKRIQCPVYLCRVQQLEAGGGGNGQAT
jgi:hypothetical protein